MEDKIEIFISYSHKDDDLRKELGNHLKFLERQGLSVLWHDHMVGAGNDWENEILKHLRTCHIILLLISADFIASDYCNCVEVKQAMERHERGEARVIPVILREVIWELMPFGKLNALPEYGKPVISDYWQKDKALRHVAEGIQKVVEELRTISFTNQPIIEQVRVSSTKSVDSNRLYNALVRLDYREQTIVFQQFKDENRRVGAFFIHGDECYGQSWLLNRLVMPLPGISVAWDFKFNFERKVCGRAILNLWFELAKKVGLNILTKDICSQKEIQDEIIKRVFGLWQRQTVILILNKLHKVDAKDINKFIEDFWYPLSETTTNISPPLPEHYLLLFFIDDENCIDEWSIPVARPPVQSWKPHAPIKLEKLMQFSYDVLADWLGKEYETLGTNLKTKDILDNSENGVPEFVLEYVCELFDYDWREKEQKWVKYRV